MTKTNRLAGLTLNKLLKTARLFNNGWAKARGYNLDAAKYVVKIAGKVIPSKALVGLALGKAAREISGGIAHVGRALRAFGLKLVALTKVALIACSASKLTHTARAREMYTGDFFRKAAVYAEQHLDGLAVLSAKYGLVLADEEIETYNHKLSTRKDEQHDWTTKVLRQLREAFDVETTTFVLLAGAAYCAGIEASDLRSENPLRGLGLGYRKAWLRERIG